MKTLNQNANAQLGVENAGIGVTDRAEKAARERECEMERLVWEWEAEMQRAWEDWWGGIGSLDAPVLKPSQGGASR